MAGEFVSSLTTDPAGFHERQVWNAERRAAQTNRQTGKAYNEETWSVERSRARFQKWEADRQQRLRQRDVSFAAELLERGQPAGDQTPGFGELYERSEALIQQYPRQMMSYERGWQDNQRKLGSEGFLLAEEAGVTQAVCLGIRQCRSRRFAPVRPVDVDCLPFLVAQQPTQIPVVLELGNDFAIKSPTEGFTDKPILRAMMGYVLSVIEANTVVLIP